MKHPLSAHRALPILLSLVALHLLPRPAEGQPFRNPHRDQTKPNIILIVADDLGYGDLGCYGQTRIQTPHIDQLAGEGMLFTQAYAGAPIDAPSQACLMTGLHGGHSPIRFNNDQPLNPSDLTLAEHFAAAQYTVGGTGKWSLGPERTTGLPTRKGFRDWVGYITHASSLDPYPEQLWRGSLEGDRIVILHGNQDGGRKAYAHDTFDKVAYNFVRTERFTPFLLYTQFTLPHATQLKGDPSLTMTVPSDAPYSAEPWPQAEKNKAAMITRLDRHIGKLLKLLADHDIDHLTAIILTSDNGPHAEAGADPGFFNSTGSLRGHKPQLYEGNLRVPLVVRWPEHVPPGTRSDQVCALWDLFPTLTDLAGLKPPPRTDGISLAPTLLGQTQTNHHKSLYWEHRTPDQVSQAVRMDHWKGIHQGHDQPFELYDLATDPGEQTNRATQHPEVVARLTSLLEPFHHYTPPPHIPKPTPAPNPPPTTPTAPEPQPKPDPTQPATPSRLPAAWIFVGVVVLIALISGITLRKRTGADR